MEEGYDLDRVYCYHRIGGLPFLHARTHDAIPYPTFKDYVDAESERGPGGLLGLTKWITGNMSIVLSAAESSRAKRSKPGYLDYVKTDGTPEGFFQWVLLMLTGNQFYIAWHANYNDLQVICDKSVTSRLPQEIQAKVNALDLAP